MGDLDCVSCVSDGLCVCSFVSVVVCVSPSKICVSPGQPAVWDSWPPTWCALPVGGGAWSAARCREYSDPIRKLSESASSFHSLALAIDVGAAHDPLQRAPTLLAAGR